MPRIAILGLNTDDYGVASNQYFTNHGPSIPKNLLQHNALGTTRAKVALSVMVNLNDAIKNLRFNQNLTSRHSIGYINVQKKTHRSTLIDFEPIQDSMLKWSASCTLPFSAIIWVDAKYEAFEKGGRRRRNCPARPLLLRPMEQPFFRPLSSHAEPATDGRRKSSMGTSAIPPIVLSNRNPTGKRTSPRSFSARGHRGRGGQENQFQNTSEIALRRAKKAAPGSIYQNINSNPGPYKLPEYKPRCVSSFGTSRRPNYSPNIASPASSLLYSSFGFINSSRPSSSMGVGGGSRTPAGATVRQQPPHRTAQRPSTVGSTAVRVRFGRNARFHHPPKHSGIAEKPVMVCGNVCMIRSRTPGPRYFLGQHTSTMGGRGNTGSQSMPKQHGQPSASFCRSPRW
jgi:hypothetical protein